MDKKSCAFKGNLKSTIVLLLQFVFETCYVTITYNRSRGTLENFLINHVVAEEFSEIEL